VEIKSTIYLGHVLITYIQYYLNIDMIESNRTLICVIFLCSKTSLKIVQSNWNLKVELIPNELIFGGDVDCAVLINILKLLTPPACATQSTGGKRS